MKYTYVRMHGEELRTYVRTCAYKLEATHVHVSIHMYAWNSNETLHVHVQYSMKTSHASSQSPYSRGQ